MVKTDCSSIFLFSSDLIFFLILKLSIKDDLDGKELILTMIVRARGISLFIDSTAKMSSHSLATPDFKWPGYFLFEWSITTRCLLLNAQKNSSYSPLMAD